MLYIANGRLDFQIPKWQTYIFGRERKVAGFSAEVNGKKKTVKDLADDEIVKLRDYPLSIIEIDFDEGTTLEEIIQLFVDINQTSIKVSRFDIVKALYLEDPFLKQIFNLVGVQQGRGKDAYFKLQKGSVAVTLKGLDIVSRMEDPQNQVDLVWEKLCEIALFAASKQHRKPSQILKDLIGRKDQATRYPKLSKAQLTLIRSVFDEIHSFRKQPGFAETRWATDQTHFYTLVTSLISSKEKNGTAISNMSEKLIRFDLAIDGKKTSGLSKDIKEKIKEYDELSTKQTTDSAKRASREALFKAILEAL